MGCWAWPAGTASSAATLRAAVRAKLVGMDFIYHSGAWGTRDGCWRERLMLGRFSDSDFESERCRYVCSWALLVCSFAANSFHRDRRDWDEWDRGDSVDDGIYGVGERPEAKFCDRSAAGNGSADF